MPGQGEIEPWKASFDGFVEHRKPARHNSHSILAAQRSTHEAVYPHHAHKPYYCSLQSHNPQFTVGKSPSRNVRAGFTSLANTYIIRGRIYTWRTIMIKNKVYGTHAYRSAHSRHAYRLWLRRQGKGQGCVQTVWHQLYRKTAAMMMRSMLFRRHWTSRWAQ